MGNYYSFCDVNNCNPNNWTTYDDLEINALYDRSYSISPLCEIYSDEDSSDIRVILVIIDEYD
jgi:hypothetical protein